MLGHLLIGAVVQTLVLDGQVMADGGDYEVVEFEVPAGVVEIQVAHAADDGQNVLDWGLWDPNGFRGWGGGLEEDAIVGASAASRGYLPGPLPAGTWQLVIGKARLETEPATYSATVTLRDAETLAPRERAAYSPVVLASEARWYAGDFHVHSLESGDATAAFSDIVGLARERGLDFVALSDHNTVSQHGLAAALQSDVDDVLLVRAAEVTTYGGHANAFGFSEYVDHRIGLGGLTATELVAAARGQGAVVSINHPALDLGGLCIGCPWEHADTPWPEIDAIEIHTGSFELTAGIFTPRAIAMWDEQLDAGHRITGIGGSDDHDAGIDLASNESPIGSPTTLVFADELSEAGILQALREGRAIVKLRGPDDPFLELYATAGGERGMIGDTVAGAKARVEAHAVGAAGLDLILYRNGEPVEAIAIETDDETHELRFDTAREGDRYRAHLALGSLPVVITNHVYVEHAPGGGGCRAAGGAGAGAGLALAALVTLARGSRRRAAGRRSRPAGPTPC